MLTISLAPARRLLGGGRAGLPDVLAHGQPDALPAELDRRARGAGLEVAPLVEDAVVGQVHLAVDRLDRAVGEHGGGVVDTSSARSGKPTIATMPVTSRGQVLERARGRRRGSARAAADPPAGSR